MSKLIKSTIYLDPRVKRFLQQKAVVEGRSVSELVNEQLSGMLEDLKDLEEIEKRRGETTVSFEDALKELGLTFDQLRG